MEIFRKKYLLTPYFDKIAKEYLVKEWNKYYKQEFLNINDVEISYRRLSLLCNAKVEQIHAEASLMELEEISTSPSFFEYSSVDKIIFDIQDIENELYPHIKFVYEEIKNVKDYTLLLTEARNLWKKYYPKEDFLAILTKWPYVKK